MGMALATSVSVIPTRGGNHVALRCGAVCNLVQPFTLGRRERRSFQTCRTQGRCRATSEFSWASEVRRAWSTSDLCKTGRLWDLHVLEGRQVRRAQQEIAPFKWLAAGPQPAVLCSRKRGSRMLGRGPEAPIANRAGRLERRAGTWVIPPEPGNWRRVNEKSADR
jgi:hypothetical protein